MALGAGSNAAGNKENFYPVSFIDGLTKKQKNLDQEGYNKNYGNVRHRQQTSVAMSDLPPDLHPNIK